MGETQQQEIRVYKYGQIDSRQSKLVERVCSSAPESTGPMNRAAADPEDQILRLVEELKEMHCETYAADFEVYWHQWAALISRERDPRRREALKSYVPPDLGRYFRPAGTDFSVSYQNMQHAASLPAKRALRAAIRHLTDQENALKQQKVLLQNALELIDAQVVTETRAAIESAEEVERQDINDPDH